MATGTDGFGTLFRTIESGDLSLPDGFFLDALPTQNDRATILAEGNSLVSVPLETPRWYSISIEVIVKNPTQGHYYVHRNLVEAYRDGGVAVLHSSAESLLEVPSGGFGFYTVTLGVSGNNVTVRLNNGSANTINFARYIGYSRKPVP